MAEDRRSDRPCGKTDSIDGERVQCSDQRVGFREIQFGKYQAGDSTVQKEVVPLDCRADGTGNDGTPELGTMIHFVGRTCPRSIMCRAARHGVTSLAVG